MLHHERSGSGEPLVLLHGIGSELGVWEPVAGALAARHEVIAVDLPGFGASPSLPEDVSPSPPALAGAVAGLLDALGLPAAHVAGNSLGGWVALELGRTGRARTVTCLNPAGLWRGPIARGSGPTSNPARRAAAAAGPALPVLLRNDGVRRAALANFMAHPERVPLEAAIRMVESYTRAPAYEATSWAMRSSHLTHAEQIRVPVTIGWGDRDRLLRPAKLAAPDVETRILAGCGHVPMWDDPEAVARLLLDGAARGTGRAAA